MAGATSMVQGWLDNRVAQAWGLAVGIVWWAIDPSLSSAFAAIWLLVGFDFATKLMALSVRNGGFIRAVQAGSIRSNVAFSRTATKILGYFILMAVAGLGRHVLGLALPAKALEALVYGFLFMVEAISITENLVGAGLTQLAPLLLRFEHEKDKLTGGENDGKRDQ